MSALHDTIGAGDLNRRVVLQTPVETPDGAGGVEVTYQDEATLWARIEPMPPLTSHADAQADAPGALIAVRVLLRAGRAITTRHRLRERDAVYRIVTIRDDARRRFLDIHAERKID